MEELKMKSKSIPYDIEAVQLGIYPVSYSEGDLAPLPERSSYLVAPCLFVYLVPLGSVCSLGLSLKSIPKGYPVGARRRTELKMYETSPQHAILFAAWRPCSYCRSEQLYFVIVHLPSTHLQRLEIDSRQRLTSIFCSFCSATNYGCGLHGRHRNES